MRSANGFALSSLRLKSNKRIIKYTINSNYFELTSDVGVFSKNELDNFEFAPADLFIIEKITYEENVRSKRIRIITAVLRMLSFDCLASCLYI
mgnify:CR=1 FL=1